MPPLVFFGLVAGALVGVLVGTVVIVVRGLLSGATARADELAQVI